MVDDALEILENRNGIFEGRNRAAVVGVAIGHRKERMNRGHSDHRRELSQKTKRAVVVERKRMDHVC